MKHQTRVSYKCAAAGCEFMSLEAADMRRHMALEHVLVVKNKDGTGMMTDEDETLSHSFIRANLYPVLGLGCVISLLTA